LISFAAIAQLAPAFFGGLFWRNGTARGAIAGILAGFGTWAYTLLLPWVVKAGWLGPDILEHGPLGIAMLRPQALFFLEFEPLTHGVLWSIFANVLALVMVSLMWAHFFVLRLLIFVLVQGVLRLLTESKCSFLRQASFWLDELLEDVASYLGGVSGDRF